MLVYTGRADGLVSGAVHSTADTVRPALQIITNKTRHFEDEWRFYYDER